MTFLVTWGWAYCIRIAFRTWAFWWPLHGIGFQKFENTAKSLNTAVGQVYSPSSQFKIRSLTSCTYNYAFCNQIQALKLESYTAPCDKKSHVKHQTLFLSHVRGSGHKTTLPVARKFVKDNLNIIQLMLVLCCHWLYVLLSLPPHACGIKV